MHKVLLRDMNIEVQHSVRRTKKTGPILFLDTKCRMVHRTNFTFFFFLNLSGRGRNTVSSIEEV